jgi:hypothetical protein
LQAISNGDFSECLCKAAYYLVNDSNIGKAATQCSVELVLAFSNPLLRTAAGTEEDPAVCVLCPTGADW